MIVREKNRALQKSEVRKGLHMMKKREQIIGTKMLLTGAMLLMSLLIWSADLGETQSRIIELKKKVSDLEQGFAGDWATAKKSEALQEQTPFESDTRFLQRYLMESSKLQQSQYQQKKVMLDELHDLLGWHFQTRSMEISLDAGKYDANTGIWQIEIKHQDWSAEELQYDLRINPKQAETLYNNRDQVEIFGDIIFDMWAQPQLTEIFISCESAGIDTSLSLGALQQFSLPNAMTSVEFSEDGSRLLIGCKDKAFHVLDIASGTERQPIRLYSNIRSIRQLPGKNQAALALTDGYLRIYDLGTEKEISQQRQYGSVEDLSVSADGRFICTASLANRLRLYDLKTGKEMLELEYPYGIKTCDLSPSGDFLAYGTEHGYNQLFEYAVVRVFAIGESEWAMEFSSDGEVECVRFSPDGKLLLYSGSEGESVIIDLASQKKIATFERAYQAEWLQGSDLIVGIGWDQELNVISTRSQDIIKTISHSEDIKCFSVSADGNYVAIGSDSGVYIYKI